MRSSTPTAIQDPPAPHAEPRGQPTERVRVCVVGAGSRFLSGISYYTNRLINALSERHDVSAILIRQMMPTRFYPGGSRVGTPLTDFTYPPDTPVYDGIDWYWGASIVRALELLRSERPNVLVLQWWTGTVLHSYLLLALVARLRGIRLVIEFHEVLDTGEQNIPLAHWYVNACAPILTRLAHGFIVHNEFDREALSRRYPIHGRPVTLVPHGPYDQYAQSTAPTPRVTDAACELLYFGVIRPFKGVEDIVTALELMTPEEVARFRLTVVGETWEGWTMPAERIAASPVRDRITFVNRYVADDEVAGFFSATDAVVLPYHRSSSSGPLHLAMASGLPVVVGAVGGLVEAASGYEGALLVPPKDPEAIRAALLELESLRGTRFTDIHSWDRTADGYDRLFSDLGELTTVGS